MALPKKKSRIITVKEVDYRWVANGNDHGVDIYVELAENPGQLLKAVADYVYDDDNKQIAVTPKHIQKLVVSALDDGWEPYEHKPTFLYQNVLS